MKILLTTLALIIAASGFARGQAPAKLPAEDVAMAPIECWWKTDRSAVRVGEQFDLTLTCAVLDTEKIKVVVDESSLSPAALHLVPFEITGGRRFRDINNSPRRFFQYLYSMRILGEDFFGKEVTLPRLQITYRVQNAVTGGAALAGREQQYSLRPVPIRVLSTVPQDAADIRDTPPDTFGDVDSKMFRSSLLLAVAAVAFGMAALLIVVLVVRATMKRSAGTVLKKRPVSPDLVLRAASRELSSVQAANQQGGWTAELAGRAAAALRLAGAVALGRPVSQREVERDAEPGEGQIVTPRRMRGKRIVLSAAVTPSTLGRNGKSALGESIGQTIAVFSTARYSRNGETDGSALDSALANGQDAIKQLRRDYWMRLGRRKPSSAAAAEETKQTWAR